jgi:hypothetical protein
MSKRTKTIKIDDVEYILSSLSNIQVDEIIFANIELREENQVVTAVVQGSKRIIRDRVCPAIAASLNNVYTGDAKWFLRPDPWKLPDGHDPKLWATPEIVGSGDLLYGDTMQLYGEVMLLTGLRGGAEVKRRTETPGEETAAIAVH